MQIYFVFLCTFTLYFCAQNTLFDVKNERYGTIYLSIFAYLMKKQYLCTRF